MGERCQRPAPRTAVWGVLALAAAGCVSFPSTARPAEPATITRERGWIAAGRVTPIRQQAARDCGPAALAMVARFWGRPIALRDATVVAEARSGGRGAKLGALRDLARSRGLTAFAIRADRATLVHELERGRPVVVGLLRARGSRRLSHFEVVVGFHPARREVATIDPAGGFGIRQWRDLAAEWDPAGRPALVVLGPSGKPTRWSATPVGAAAP
jgi:ABC-type bacteriocin/lantibiotic exporter with double-glycine peptidase domain